MSPLYQTLAEAPASKAALIAHFHDRLTGEMIYSALHNDAAKLDMFLASGVQINHPGDEGLTPLIVALLTENRNATNLLLERGADPNQQDNEGESPMSIAAQRTDRWFLEILLKHRGNVNVVNKRNKTTPIFDAIGVPSLKNVELLVEHKANLSAREEHDETPLHFAALRSQYDIVLFLLKSGANPKAKDVWGKTINYDIRNNSFDEHNRQAPFRQQVINWLKEHGAWQEN